MERMTRLPPHVSASVQWCYAVPEIVARPIVDIDHRRFCCPQMTNDSFCDLAVRKLVSRRKVVDFAGGTFFQDLADTIAKIFHICPVSNLSPTTIQRDLHLFEAAKYSLRDEFLGMLVGPEVVRATDDHDWHFVGLMPCSSKHIRRCLRG